MDVLEISSYTLAVLANIEIIVGIVLTVTAMVQDKQLRQNSNIMIPCMLIPDLARVIIANMQVMEYYHPFLDELAHVACIVIDQWGMITCSASMMWLLSAIAVHRYFLCVKMRMEINQTKTCILISGLSLIIPVAILAIVACVYTWLTNETDDNLVEGLKVPNQINITGQIQLNTALHVVSDTAWNNVTESHQNISASLKAQGCFKKRDINNVTDSVKWAVVAFSMILPMCIQVCFYDKIYQHLKAERQRFQTSRQVATRLHSNSRAVLYTLRATCACHFVMMIPRGMVGVLGLSINLEVLTKMLTQNATTAGTLCFLGLHGGYR